MKSLVFNLMVVGALGFLLFDGKAPESVDEAMDKVAAKTEHLLDKGREMVGTQAAEPQAVTEAPVPVAVPPARDRAPAQPAPTAPPAPAQAADTKPADTKPAPVQAARTKPAPAQTAQTPAPTMPAVKRPPVKTEVVEAPPARPAQVAARNPAVRKPAVHKPGLDPDVAKRRAEILGTAPQDDAGDTETAQGFMEPPVRRAELQRLAEDMELMFVDKTVR